MDKPLYKPFQIHVDTLVIHKIPHVQHFYEGMPIVFINNKYFATRNATKNLAYTVLIALDPSKPPEDFTKPYRQLQHLPKYVFVRVPNAKMGQLFLNLPPQVILMTSAKHYAQVRLSDNHYMMPVKHYLSHVNVACEAMPWVGVHAVT